MKKQKIYGTAAALKKAKYNNVKLPLMDRFIFIMVLMVRHVMVLLKPATQIGERIVDSKNIYDMMSVSPWFPAPDPTLAEFLVLITNYENAAAAVKAGAANAEAKLIKAWDKLDAARRLLQNYVQAIVIKNPDDALEIATSAGMTIKKASRRDVQEFTVKATAEGGADLSSKVKSPYGCNEWQCTMEPSDPMGWHVKLIDSTIQSKTSVGGFTAGSIVYFRHRTILRTGPTPWSDIISVMMLR